MDRSQAVSPADHPLWSGVSSPSLPYNDRWKPIGQVGTKQPPSRPVSGRQVSVTADTTLDPPAGLRNSVPT